MVAGVAVMAMPTVAFAQAAEAAEKATFLTSNGAAWLGGAIGAGLAINGWRCRHRRIGGSAVESMAGSLRGRADLNGHDHHRRHDRGATLFAVVVGMLAVLK